MLDPEAGRRFRQQKRLGAQPAGQRRLIGNSTVQRSCAGMLARAGEEMAMNEKREVKKWLVFWMHTAPGTSGAHGSSSSL
jgi:hypothetical protein